MKICVVTCYSQPDYIRARTLRKAVGDLGYELITVKNTKKGIFRYFEVAGKLFIARIKERPDVYILTFRGYEILPIVWLITIGKTLIFDEFINLYEWVVLEHKKLTKDSVAAKVLHCLYKTLLRLPAKILSDTSSHADFSAGLMNLPSKKFARVIVGTDEAVFASKKRSYDKPGLSIFYYGSMLPLHGVPVVLDAMIKLKHEKEIRLVLIGGKEKTRVAVEHAKKNGANIEYAAWVDFEKLPNYVESADLCLAGPFGATVQSDFVIKGKAFKFLCMGKPTVIGMNEESDIFRDKKDSLLVKQGSSKELADCLLWAFENKNKLGKIGLEGQKIYQKQLSSDVVKRQLSSALAFYD